MIAIRNKDYVWSIGDILKHPLDPLTPHLIDIAHIYFNYLSLPLIIALIFGLFLLFRLRSTIYHLQSLFLWWLLPLFATAAIAKVFTARYFLFTLPPLVILLSFGIYFLSKKIKFNVFLLIILLSIPNIIWIVKISARPQDTKLPRTESGYLSDWTSGWGIKEASVYLKERAKAVNVIVGTEGYFGTLPDGLQAYSDSIPHLTIFGVGLGFDKIPEKLVDARNYGDEVYILINKSRLKLLPSELEKLTLMENYPKPENDSLLLYKLK